MIWLITGTASCGEPAKFPPSQIEFYDREVKRESRGRDCRFDMVETILSQADKHGTHVFLGLGRGGDLWMLWEFEKPGWQKRNEEAIALSTRIARELWQKYGHHRSFYAWHLCLHDPACRGNQIDARAVQLFQSYSAWKKQHDRPKEKR